MQTIRRHRPPTMEARALALINACIGRLDRVAVLRVIDEHLPQLASPLAEDIVAGLNAQLSAIGQLMGCLDLDAEFRWYSAQMLAQRMRDAALLAVTMDWAR